MFQVKQFQLMRFTWKQHDAIVVNDNALWWANPIALDQDMIAKLAIARIEIDSVRS